MADNENSPQIFWLSRPEDHNYTAAISYLSLIFKRFEVEVLVENLRKADLHEFKAKDIFRASGLSLLGVSNSHVAKTQKKITKNKALSPILLVRDTANSKVVIADGYHRMCAIYGVDEDAWIKCKIV